MLFGTWESWQMYIYLRFIASCCFQGVEGGDRIDSLMPFPMKQHLQFFHQLDQFREFFFHSTDFKENDFSFFSTLDSHFIWIVYEPRYF